VTYQPGNAHEATEGLTNRWAGGKISASELIEASGETTLHTPEATKELWLYWIWLYSSQENTGEVKAEVVLGAQTPYTTYLGNPGAFAHWELVKGAVGQPLVVRLSGAQKVAVSYTYTEQVP
jgi:hypothetical protein